MLLPLGIKVDVKKFTRVRSWRLQLPLLSGFVKGKVSIAREEVRIYDQYLIAESVFAGLTFIDLFPTPSLLFSLVGVFGCTS